MNFEEGQFDIARKLFIERLITRRGKEATLRLYPEYEDFIKAFYINPRNEPVKIDLSSAIEKIKPSIESALKEVEDFESGKKEPKSFDEFLNELS